MEADAFRILHSAFHHVRLTYRFPALSIEAVDNHGTIFFAHTLMASSHRRRSAEPLGADDNDEVGLTVYGTKDCEDCRLLLSKVLPSVLEGFPANAVTVEFVAMDGEEKYRDYAALESRLGQRRHSFPVVRIGNRLFSGSELTEGRLTTAIRGARPAGHARGPASLFVATATALALVLAGAAITVWRRWTR
jgi:hypothetical protein